MSDVLTAEVMLNCLCAMSIVNEFAAPRVRQHMRMNGERFLHVHGVVQNLFRLGGHRLRAVHYRRLRARSFSSWSAVTPA